MTGPLVRDIDHLASLLDKQFSPEQAAAITAPLEVPQVIIAGAGSGKTTVMAARVVWLVGHVGISPEKVLGLTFTNKAAAELKQRVLSSLARVGEWSDTGEPTVSTYHAFAGALISEHGLRLGMETDLHIVSDASKFQRLSRVISAYDRPLAYVSTHVPTLIADVVTLDGQLSEHLVTTDALRAYDSELIAMLERADMPIALHRTGMATALKRTELSRLVDRYRAAKSDDGVMDFADQMAWGAQLAFDPDVGSALRDRFDVVLLDEYQDTSVAQRDLLQALFSGPDPEHGRGHSVTAVGDPAQGIYGWRGAAAGNLADFLHDFPDAQGNLGQLHSLDTSYRCAPQVIDLANKLADPFYRTSRVVKPLQAHKTQAGDVTVASYLTVADEILALRDRVLQVHAADDTTQWSDIAILARQGAEIPEIVATLRRSGVPVEVVGLNGLLAQPEVQDVLAMLDVLDDVTANPSLLRILTGPLWRIGPRDLALLGRRAASLAGSTFSLDDDSDLAGALQQAVAGTDPADVLSLADALEDPGHGPYSPEALYRFKELAGRLTGLRTHISEPLVDFVRRVLHDLDLDIELGSLGGGNGMDNIALLLEAIATYAENDRFASLAGLLSYLSFESEFNAGMEVSVPSEADSVKLLTVHKAKGLEWKAVFVPFLSAKVFPSDKSRPRWISNASALPIELRGDRDSIADLESWDTQGEKEFKAAAKIESDNEELRLGYVALTRAESALHLSGHVWGRTQLKPRGPSPYLETARDWLAESGGSAEPWCDVPGDDDEAGNPFASQIMRISWPTDLRELGRRRSLAQSVRAHVESTPDLTEPEGSPEESADLASLDALSADLELLLQEAEDARSDVVSVPLPASLSATTALRLAGDPSELARDLARPMPRRPSAGARFGTRFHAWVEAHFGQQALLDPGDLPGKGDDDITDDADLRAMTDAFRAGPYGDTEPFAIEAPFSLTLGGQQVIGRIDAIYQTATGFEVVDWKTNQTASADAVQLAIYRLAWAELRGIDPALVTAAFYYVRLGEVRRFDDLPGREELTKRLGL